MVHAQRTATNPRDGMTLVYVPGGEFMMGSDDFSIERPPHLVRVSPFWLGRTEVTNGMYRRFMSATNRPAAMFMTDGRFNADDQPVVGVDWSDAEAYCRWADGRLPTEAEWEFAARGSEGRLYPWGNDEPEPDQAVFGLLASKGTTAPVGSKPGDVSPFGALDLAGNVLEWCADWAGAYPPIGAEKDTVVIDPLGPSQGTKRIMRGACWVYSGPALRASERLYTLPNLKRFYAGFRMAVGTDTLSPPDEGHLSPPSWYWIATFRDPTASSTATMNHLPMRPGCPH